MAANNDIVPPFLGGMFIVADGLITLPHVVMGAVHDALASYFQDAKPADFDTFFQNALNFSDNEAKNLTFRYLTCAQAFSFAPGLGGTKAGSKFGGVSLSDLEDELRKAGIGKPSNGAGGSSIALRLTDYLKQYKNPAAAKSALTPAKRDALRMEASKLLGIRAAVWVRLYRNERRMTAIGVRG